MGDSTVQLNLPTSTGAKIHTDQVVISTVTGQIQRMKVGFGTDGVYTETSTNNAFPVQFVSAQEVSLATTQGIFLKTSTGGAIPADTTSGLAVKFVSSQSVDINNSNLVSTNNSTSATLANDAIYTGTGEDISKYASITVQVFASHASATNGLSIEFSTDNSNWDELHTADVAATTPREFIIPVHAQYLRIVYTNGGTTQTAFRLQTILHVQALPGEAEALENSESPDTLGLLTKSCIIAQAAGTGDFIPIQSTAGGNLKVAVEEFDASLPTGTNHIGSVALETSTGGIIPADTTSGLAVKFVNSQPVAVTEITPGASASNIGKAEDAVHGSGDIGVMALAVRNDALASLVNSDGDYSAQQVNAIGALWTKHAPNLVDSNNSTTSTLANDAVYTGTGVDVLEASSVAVTIDASHDSATDGIQLQFSTDNSNWDVEHLFTYTAANGARIFQLGAHTQYFRLVYTNGGTSQTHFRVQTLLINTDIITTIHRLVDAVDPDRSATLVKSVILGQAAGSGNFVPVQTTAAGNFKVAVEEFDTSLPTGTNHIGSVALETSTGGIIPADTTSGLAVKFVNAQDVNLATGGGVFLRTSTGGIIPSDTTSGLKVNVSSLPSVNLVSGQGIFLKTSTGGTIPADTTSGLAVKFVNTPTMTLSTGTPVIINTAPALATGDRGPRTVNVTASGTSALVTAAGANTSIYVTGILITNTATTVHRGALSDGTNRLKHSLAANGGGFCWSSLNPPWKMPGNTALNWVTTDTVNIDATIHFYTGAT